MKRTIERSVPPSEVMLPEDEHLEIEISVEVKNKKDKRRIQDAIGRRGFLRTKHALIVDVVEPSRSAVTSRVRFQMDLDDPNNEQAINCFMGKKSHSHPGWIEPFVRLELDPEISAEMAVRLWLQAVAAQGGKLIPAYCKKRWYHDGQIDDGVIKAYKAQAALDKAEGLLKRYPKRVFEVESKMSVRSRPEDIEARVISIARFMFDVIGEDRKIQISYRRKVKKTWKKRGMCTWKRRSRLVSLIEGQPAKKSNKKVANLLSSIARAA